MSDYKKAGVNIEEGYETVTRIKEYVKETHDKNVLGSLGNFAGLYELSGYSNPVLVSGADGIGTKLEIALENGVYDTVGIDCVAMCVNDIICQGASPLFFLDYLACGKLDSEKAASIVKGIAEGCQQAGCSLIGGETAEMPGFYKRGKYDVAGFAVGVIEKDRLITGDEISKNDVLIGIASNGLHSNGFSLVRYMIQQTKRINGDAHLFHGKPLWRELLKPTRIYANAIKKLISQFRIKGIAHITGGGLYENVPRMTENDVELIIRRENIPKQPIFKFIQSLGVEEEEMYKTFNMGVGMVICVDKDNILPVLAFLNSIGEKAFEIGQVEDGGNGVCLV